ncbi:MAM domain-containing glycosylphosphatidylinositol anchor protein 1-like [Physella acuta]|uniref:MAM domain-containing glycosylphosphatidylinositol anchor protein 1-like n=1 Tax=Physella acuta TaxID=109671 RepID=UPI0027DE1C8F|nr:MAM domain-containing glycosylphosphatidylinositol anchor protein 1-like [Physella acuta]
MFGEHIGTLTVKLTNVLSATELVLWAASGDQGNRWHIKELEYNAQEAYQISFDGTVGPSYRGDIAIDNIAITEGGCLSSLQVNCSFTHSLCGWVNAPAPGDILDWTRHRGETETPDTGPLSDRLGPNGYYVYVESSRTTLGDMARLVSPTIRSSLTGYCFTFWYHMYGRTVGNLTVSSQSSNGRETVLWSKLGDQGNSWHSGYINITSNITSSQSFKIVFEATMVGFSGDVAIDDVSLQESLCNQR